MSCARKRTAFFIGKSIFTDKGEMTYDMIETMKNGYE